MVRRILIWSSQDVKKMGSGAKLSMSLVEGEGNAMRSGTADN